MILLKYSTIFLTWEHNNKLTKLVIITKVISLETMKEILWEVWRAHAYRIETLGVPGRYERPCNA